MKNSTGDIRTNEAPEILDLDEDENPVYDTSTVRLSSPVPSDQAEQPTDTQSSNATTITLSSPYDTSTGRLSSPVPSDQAQQLTDTQTSNATTITLSSQEQTVNRWKKVKTFLPLPATPRQKKSVRQQKVFIFQMTSMSHC